MKNRYLLVLGAKTTGAKHRTFSKDFLRFPKVNCRVHQERALTAEILQPKSYFCFTGERFVTMYFCCGPVCSPQIELIFDSPLESETVLHHCLSQTQISFFKQKNRMLIAE